MSRCNGTLLIGLLFCLWGCDDGNARPAVKTAERRVDLPAVRDRQLNLSVLIDLSNRIDPQRHPEQVDRDIATIGDLAQVFRNNVDAYGAFKANARLRVYFHPEPKDPQMAVVARQLTAECKAGNSPEHARNNKLVYQRVEDNFRNGLREIYALANRSGSYPGSNIWRFMKDEAKVKCVEPPGTYRNILVILTDGYLFYENEKHRTGNLYSYIERNYDHFKKFRNTALLHSVFEQEQYGLEPTGADLSDLEVLVVGIAPEEKYPQDFDIIRKYWSQWFSDMGIRHFDFIKTGQPVYTTKILGDFLQHKAL